MLELKEVHTYYGNIHALKGISLKVEDGEIVTLIGSNGAGKSTTLRTIQGINRPCSGTILLDGTALETLPPHEIAKRGVAQSPEGRLIFPRMTVLENLEMGAYARKEKTGFDDDLERVFTLFPRLKERIGQKGGTLSGGEQQMLAMGRCSDGKAAHSFAGRAFNGSLPHPGRIDLRYHRNHQQRRHHRIVGGTKRTDGPLIANRGYVIQTGEILLTDTAANLKQNEMVRKSYLGIE